MPISTPNVWELRADPGRIRASARAWLTLGDAVQLAQSVVDGEVRSLGTGWTGNAADAYHEHRGRMVRAGADVTDAASEVGKTLSQIADLLETADDILSASLRTLTTWLANDQVAVDKVGDELVFQTWLPPHEDAVLAEISRANQIRARVDYSLSSALRVILAQRPALGDADDRREREAARAHLEITPNDPGSTFVKDVKACLDTFDRPDGDPEGIMPTIYDPDKTILVVESTSKDTSWTYHSRSIPDHARVSLLWQPDPDLPALNGTQCEILYHELYHVYDGFQHTMDSSECGDTGIPIAEVKASFATDAYLRAQFGPSWYLDDKGNRVERPHLQEYDGKRLPSSIDECYDSSEEYRDGRGGASNDGREVSGDGGAEGAGGVGGAPGSR